MWEFKVGQKVRLISLKLLNLTKEKSGRFQECHFRNECNWNVRIADDLPMANVGEQGITNV